MICKKGIDVSKHQGAIHWDKVDREQVDFAILRAGYGRYAKQIDVRFAENYAGAKAAGIPVGAYWYSYATAVSDAQREAEICLLALRDKQFEYPIWFDQEYEPAIQALSRGRRTEIVRAFCSALEQAGYYCGLYASTDWINNRLNYTELEDYDVWAAQYGPRCASRLPYGMWQYSSTGQVAGVDTRVDLDFAYKDYPAIMRRAGLNGFAKENG